MPDHPQGGHAMAEIMTVESIIEADWLLQKYWVKVRYPIKTEKGSWSDIDVLAYSPDSRHLVISESKVQGSKNVVWAYIIKEEEYTSDVWSIEEDAYLNFVRHVPAVCRSEVFDDFSQMVKQLTVQLVSNWFVAKDIKSKTEEKVRSAIQGVPKGIKLDVRLETTLHVICRIIRTQRESTQGKRYGHPVIDLARELNRYMHPDIRGAGKGKMATEPIKREFRDLLTDALNGELLGKE
jgi:hypothetical protein